MVYSTEDYATCNTRACKDAAALRRRVVDGNINTCFRFMPTENNKFLMVVLDDYHPIYLVRIMATDRLSQVEMSVGNYSELQ